jgi:ParB/RepB/Spo0J family partition protein
MSPRKKYDPAAAATRARAVPAVHRAGEHAAATSAAPEYRHISVHQIDPAPWQARVLFEGIEELAASIIGDGVVAGVGILEPVLVRALGEERFELIDGERRLRAARLIAERSPSGDFVLPARVFVVSDAMAQALGMISNLARRDWCPIEKAIAYHNLRAVLEAEPEFASVSSRMMVDFAPDEKSTIADYLRIADALTPDVLERAGVPASMVSDRRAALGKLKKGELHTIAKLRTDDERALALRARLDRADGTPVPKRAIAGAEEAATPESRRLSITREGFALKVKQPAELLPPDQARDVITRDLAPAMLAFAERAHGGGGRDGFYLDVQQAHLLLVVPTEVEALSLPHLTRLAQQLDVVRKRVMRSRRARSPRVRASTDAGTPPGDSTETVASRHPSE